jgi:hypothetical protein
MLNHPTMQHIDATTSNGSPFLMGLNQAHSRLLTQQQIVVIVNNKS